MKISQLKTIIAETFYRSGIIEKWGTGTLKIIDWCKSGSTPPPIWNEQSVTLCLTFYPALPFEKAATPQVTPQVTPEVTPEVKRLLNAITDEHSRKELQEMLRLKDPEHFRKSYLLPAIKTGFVEMTRPDKPRSKLQKYRLTADGLAVQKELGK